LLLLMQGGDPPLRGVLGIPSLTHPSLPLDGGARMSSVADIKIRFGVIDDPHPCLQSWALPKTKSFGSVHRRFCCSSSIGAAQAPQIDDGLPTWLPSTSN
jgi:hypothetical protein